MAITVYEIALAFCKSFVSVLLLLLPPLHSTSAHLSFLLFFFSLPGRIVINLFFREIRPRGAYNIPRSGPVLFVGAPHQYIRLSLSLVSKKESSWNDIHLFFPFQATNSSILFSSLQRFLESREGESPFLLLPKYVGEIKSASLELEEQPPLTP